MLAKGLVIALRERKAKKNVKMRTKRKSANAHAIHICLMTMTLQRMKRVNRITDSIAKAFMTEADKPPS